MYDELVKRLRESKNEQCYIGCFGNCGDCKIDAELEQAADAIEELSKPKWIPVTERLPRDRQFVLVYCGDNKRIRPSDRFDVAILLGDSIFTSLGVTHWMPLPQPPKEE